MVLISLINKNVTYCRLLCKQSIRVSSSKTPQTVFIEKLLEDPIIVTDANNEVDIIGPPDPISNLRPIIRKRPLTETAMQQHLREMQNATQLWNQEFWSKHNVNFRKEKEAYIKSQQKEGEERKQLTADEMSDFYKTFLDKNWYLHLNYNREWYKRNFTLLYLSLRVYLEKMFLVFHSR